MHKTAVLDIDYNMDVYVMLIILAHNVYNGILLYVI